MFNFGLNLRPPKVHVDLYTNIHDKLYALSRLEDYKIFVYISPCFPVELDLQLKKIVHYDSEKAEPKKYL